MAILSQPYSDRKTITITSMRGKAGKLAKAYHRLSNLFNELKGIAPQLILGECWHHLLQKIVGYFEKKTGVFDPPKVFLPTG